MNKTIEQPSLFEPQAHARRSDPETSQAAAESVRDLRRSQSFVLLVIEQHGPCSDEQIIREYHLAGFPLQSDSGLRTRRSELVKRGLVIDSGSRSVTESGRRTILWRAWKATKAA